jgi:hypothetical protein
VVAVAVLAAILPAYHYAGTSYYRYRLNTVRAAALKSCGGPATNDTQGYQQAQIDHCMATDDTLIKAQADYDSFTKKG